MTNLSILRVLLLSVVLLPLSLACNVCPDSDDYDQDLIFPNWGMRCDQLYKALAYGLDCSDIQGYLGVFCGCPGAVATCGVCPGGGAAPRPDLAIPFSSTTCGEINGLASLRRSSTRCDFYLDTYDFDVQGYCCSGGEEKSESQSAPSRSSSFCPTGLAIGNSTLVPDGSDGSTCSELEHFAKFVEEPQQRAFVKGFSVDCCTERVVTEFVSSYYHNLIAREQVVGNETETP